MSSTTVCGVRFSDQLAALLDHAATCDGWRVEADTRAKATGVVVYPADKAHSPITVEERKAQFNRAHYENLRRQMDRAGLPPMPAEVAAAAKRTDDEDPTPVDLPDPTAIIPARSAAEALAKSPKGTKPASLGAGFGMAETPDMARLFNDEDRAPDFVAELAMGLAAKANVGPAEVALLGTIVENLVSWSLAMSPDRLGEMVDDRSAVMRAEFEGQITEALQMAEDADKARIAAERRAERAEAKEQQARDDCGAALKRAKTAEAEAERLAKALAPLRALLNEAS